LTRTRTPSSAVAGAIVQPVRRKIAKREVGRRRAVAAGPLVDDPMLLQRRTVRPATAVQYVKAADEFLAWTRQHNFNLTNQKQSDLAMRRYLIHLFLRGEPAYAARVALFGYIYKMGLNKRDPLEMPGSRASLAGFWKSAPEAQRDPCPW